MNILMRIKLLVIANYTWFRELSPEEHMNDLYGRGSDREVEYNGIKYVFLEWLDLKQTNLLFFYSLGC